MDLSYISEPCGPSQLTGSYTLPRPFWLGFVPSSKPLSDVIIEAKVAFGADFSQVIVTCRFYLVPAVWEPSSEEHYLALLSPLTVRWHWLLTSDFFLAYVTLLKSANPLLGVIVKSWGPSWRNCVVLCIDLTSHCCRAVESSVPLELQPVLKESFGSRSRGALISGSWFCFALVPLS